MTNPVADDIEALVDALVAAAVAQSRDWRARTTKENMQRGWAHDAARTALLTEIRAREERARRGGYEAGVEAAALVVEETVVRPGLGTMEAIAVKHVTVDDIRALSAREETT